MIKKPSIAPKPQGSITPSVEKLLSNAAANRDNQMEIPPSKNKKQIPLMIPPTLLETLDEAIASTGSGTSRSVWICETIVRRLKAEGFIEDQKKKAGDSSGVSAAESSADA